IGRHTVDEVLDLTSAFRIPNAPIVNGENATTFEHFRSRQTFAPNPKDGTANPRPPYRLGSASLRPAEPAPRLGEHTIEAVLHRRRAGRPVAKPAPPAALPFEGLRVLDMTAFWAGPLT